MERFSWDCLAVFLFFVFFFGAHQSKHKRQKKRSEGKAMTELDNIEGLRATLAKTVASLPEVFRSCSVETLVNDIGPIFADEDYTR